MSKQITTPQSKDWNNFWSADKTEKFTQISWSKKRIMAILNRYIVGEGSVVLDAGCGSGFFSKYFCDKGCDTYSLDYSNEALRIAERLTKGKTKRVQCDFLNDALGEKISVKADLIFTDGLFEHFSIEDQNKIALNFKSVLKDKGCLVTFVPNRFSPWELIRPLYMPGIEEKPFVLSGLMDVNERNGFKVFEKGGINTFPFALSPDKLVGKYFGMLLYTVARKKVNS